MIAFLSGKVKHFDHDSLILNVSGVGYLVKISREVAVGISSGDSLDAEGTLELLVHTDVRETDIELFGFQRVIEREVFLLLKKVRGIGSKLALTIVSSLGAERVFSLIATEDIKLLCQVPGVGKKTAERIVLELREKVAERVARGDVESTMLPAGDSSQLGRGLETSHSSTSQFPLASIEADVVLALCRLGFKENKAVVAVKAALEGGKNKDIDAGELLQLSLQHVA